jgi:uncharacterized protein YfaS (alpha-2-macroglobulin family)
MNTTRTLLSLTSLLILAACQHPLKPEHTPGTPEVVVEDEKLSLVFAESMIQTNPDEIRAEFSPPFSCHWVWSNDQTLDCVYELNEERYEAPIEPTPNTRYVLSFKNSLINIRDEQLMFPEISFQSSHPRLYQVQVVDRKLPLRPVIKITFNSGISVDPHTTGIFSLINGSHSIDLQTLDPNDFTLHARLSELVNHQVVFAQPMRELEFDTDYVMSIIQDIPSRTGNVSMPKGNTGYGIQTFPEKPVFLQQSCAGNHWNHDDAYSPPCYLDDSIIIHTNTPLDLNQSSLYCNQHHFRTGRSRSNSAYLTLFSLYERKMDEYIDHTDVVTRCISKLRDLQGQSIDVLDQLNLSTEMGLRPKINILRGSRQLIPQHNEIELSVKTTNLKRFKVHIDHINGQPFEQTLDVEVGNFSKTEERITAVDLSNLVDGAINSVSGFVSSTGLERNGIAFEISRSPYIITLKHNPRHVALWLMDSENQQPVSNRDITVHTPLSSYPGTTDVGGFVQLEINPDDFQYEDELINDLSLTISDQHSVVLIDDLSEFAARLESDEPDNWWSALREGDLFIWGLTDKPLYRPGEQVRLKAYVRVKNDTQWLIPETLPSMGAFVEGNGINEYLNCYDYADCQSFFKQQLPEVNEWGGFEFTFRIPDNAFNGEYRMQFEFLFHDAVNEQMESWLRRDKKSITAEVMFNVSDFQTSPYKVVTQVKASHVKAQTPVTISATASYHSGGPVVHEQAEVIMSVEGFTIADDFPELAEYDFARCDECYADQQFIKSLQFDTSGALAIKAVPDTTNIRYGKILINTGLKPEGAGWTYSQFTELPYREQDHFLGLKLDRRTYRLGQSAQLDSTLVDYLGHPVAADQHSFKLYRNDPENHHEWHFVQNLICEDFNRCEFKTNSTGAFQVQVTASVGEETAEHQLTYYVYNPRQTSKTPISHSTTISANQDSYAVGDVAEFEILFPENQINTLVYVERNAILNQWHKRSENGVVNVAFTVTEAHVPGFTLATGLIPAHPKQQDYIEQSTLHVKVAGESSPHSFSINTDASQYQPGETVQLEIESDFSTPAEYTVSVIDQAVLELINEGYFYDLNQSTLKTAQNEWLMMDGFMIVPREYDEDRWSDGLIFYEDEWVEEQGRITVTGSRIRREDLAPFPPSTDGTLKPPRASEAMDMSGSGLLVAGLSVDPNTLRNLFRESAYFQSGLIIATDEKALVDIPLPDNLTSWKILVWAADQSGQIELKSTDIQARRPLEIFNDLPVQLTEGDEFVGHTRVINKTGQNEDIRLHTEVSNTRGTLASARDLFNQATPNQQYRQQFNVKITDSEPLKVISAAKTEEQQDAVLQTIPVRKSAVHFSGQINEFLNQHQHTVTLSPQHAVAGTGMNVDIRVSDSLRGTLTPSYTYNKNYPHGCWEQQLSRAVALAIELDLDKPGDPQEQQQKMALIDDILEQSIDYQADNGGMTFFSGRKKHVNEFLTFHTAQVFGFLQQLGHQTPEQVNNRIQSFAAEYIKEFEQYQVKQRNRWSYIKHNHTPLLYLMALAANQSTASQDVLKKVLKQPQQLSLTQINQLIRVKQSHMTEDEVLILLNQQYANQGDRRVLKKPLNTEWHTLNSDISEQCNSLISILGTQAGKTQAENLYPHVLNLTTGLRSSGTFGNTFENTTCLMAFHHYIQQFEHATTDHSNSAVTVSVNQLRQAINSPVKLRFSAPEQIDINITNPKNEALYLSANYQYWREPNSTPGNNGLDLERSYFKLDDGQWQPTEADDLVVGDWVVVRLTITNPIPRKFMAVSSPNPGGWVPTDINLNSVAPAGMRNSELNLQDSYFYERQLNPATSLFYTDFLPAGRHRIHYAGQVRTAGAFTALPAQAEAMYQPDVRAATPLDKWLINE